MSSNTDTRIGFIVTGLHTPDSEWARTACLKEIKLRTMTAEAKFGSLVLDLRKKDRQLWEKDRRIGVLLCIAAALFGAVVWLTFRT